MWWAVKDIEYLALRLLCLIQLLMHDEVLNSYFFIFDLHMYLILFHQTGKNSLFEVGVLRYIGTENTVILKSKIFISC